MSNFGDIPDSFVRRAQGAAKHGGGMGDYVEPFVEGVRPATSMPLPPGPANFPVNTQVPATTDDLLRAILKELIYQNIASRPVTRGQSISSAGGTLDWSTVGVMDRLMLKNNGPDNVYFSFNMNGQAVVANTSDLSILLKPDSTYCCTHTLFNKIGLKSVGTSAVDAVGYQTVAGNQAAAIS